MGISRVARFGIGGGEQTCPGLLGAATCRVRGRRFNSSRLMAVALKNLFRVAVQRVDWDERPKCHAESTHLLQKEGEISGVLAPSEADGSRIWWKNRLAVSDGRDVGRSD